MAITTMLPQSLPVAAASERTLYLYYTHTRETARITFKRNGQYVQSGLNQLNQFLRDWRRNEPAKMDPRLFDLVWEVYQEVGATQPINIVSAYRSPATNKMLRERSSGVAENSQHIQGKAMDFFIPGIPLNKLRAVAMKKQVGGVGYYPTSGSPFVHLDTGNVRAWPRMTTAQLKEIFPDGKTMHLPTNGKPLSQQGYQLAQAEWQKCHQVPCGGSSNFAVASNGGRSGSTLVDLLFGGGNQQQQQQQATAPVQVAAAATQPQIPAAPKVAPIPAMRSQVAVALAKEPEAIPFSTQGSTPLEPDLLTAELAPVPARKSDALVAATNEDDAETGTAVMAIAALDAPLPAPRPDEDTVQSDAVLTAYAAPALQNQATQQKLENIIETAALPAPHTPTANKAPLSIDPNIQTAAIGGSGSAPSLLDRTWGAMSSQPAPTPIAEALATLIDDESGAIPARDTHLIAPDLEHVAATMIAPIPVSSPHFAVIFGHDEADFSPATELGAKVPRMGIGDIPPSLSATRFTKQPLVVAAR